MPRAAVLGSPIGHSLSPVLHNAGYEALGLHDWHYSRIECDAAELPGVVESADEEFRGFSVTMPGKFAALGFATKVTQRAKLMGSANTLVRTAEGWLADNTDTEGVEGALAELLDNAGDANRTSQRRALVIGSGGTARPALWALAKQGFQHIDLLNRTDRRAELSALTDALGLKIEPLHYKDNLRAVATKADVIVSTVPSAAINDHVFSLAHAPVLDVIYDPWPTPLTACAAADGYRTVGGHRMLAYQAFSQFEQFTGFPAPKEAMFAALAQHISQRG
ncbi:MAG: shikimate dehydrogenase [Corynebacterium sp.]|nr:shikimate dehydrogenase [Corynebacterium sp.]